MRLALLLAVHLILSSCVIVPTGLPEQEPFQENSLDFIERGRTTKQEIRDTLSEAASLVPSEGNAGRWWLYQANREMGAYVACLFLDTAECEGFDREERQYYLLIEFDEFDVVTNYIVTDEQSAAETITDLAISVGRTTKSELRSKLGDALELNNGARWLFLRSPLLFTPYCRGDGYLNCGIGGTRNSFLVVDFDDAEVVRDFALNAGRNPCNSSTRVCYAEGLVMLRGNRAADQRAKQFRSSSGQCPLYIYRHSGPSAALLLDGDWIGNIVSSDSYYHLDLSQGTHELAATGRGRRNQLTIDCDEGDQIFVQLGQRYDDQIRLESTLEIARNGRRAVIGRQISAYHPDLRRSDYPYLVGSPYISVQEAFKEAVRQLPRNRTDSELSRISTSLEGDLVRIREYSDDVLVASWGQAEIDVTCGFRSALQREFSPVGGSRDLFLVDPGHRRVDVQAICTGEKTCTFPSIVEGESCAGFISDEVEFDARADLLLVWTSARDVVTVAFYGRTDLLKQEGQCNEGWCSIPLAKLLELQ